MSLKEYMMPVPNHGVDAVSRYRESMREAGYRPVQFWVLDARSDSLVATLKTQCKALRGSLSEADAMGFGEVAASLIEGWE